ncbi:AfsR/SARP family transcriptional regulator [Lentzea sp. NPDC051838]|uniref:AfsR/SARP family transcriptional regulator n=1 Tax=Lentzea sp. NPDC051838 TaxID=3154849 RepID=UPI0034293247
MQLGVLGPLQVTSGGKSFVPTAPKSRQLLALLLISANEFVSVDACVEELWAGNPPNSFMSTLHTYVLHVRRMLKHLPGGKDLLLTRTQGYQLVVPPGTFDRAVFDDHVREAREALARNENHLAASTFRSALALWRGTVLADVPASTVITAYQVELTERRLGVLEQRIEADLRLGRHANLLPELHKLTQAHPTHENIHAQLMIALYRSDRRGKAIQVFHHLSRLLGDQLGLQPCNRMQRLHEAIVNCDPALVGPVSRGPVRSLCAAAS